ncbi:MAG: peptidylprolyl isomerase [Candidatus Zambryskibacteria bacterium CG10_big_fil_rev_8_21_14_0_10_42_12]|uniref:Peptidyl-prolyl cis-trans isomerase n=1 Tax=Candidatus Zambryskibacteria bacterium CG10_big_fil_rev_8_21_14_0_10_42_12 TaxID=1975115 RepID=A0A2H0QVZ6_9BACT|nr:MAG: peptidylprolyl isomerase [Candidatus Zambryskibacteria bacterium CG10_big_fil_rev_8_21_14_0_10_42_12]
MDNENTQSLGGLTIETIAEGTGAEVRAFDELTVHYTGTLTNGTVFDSSVTRGTPFTFVIGQGSVIAGWEEGLLGMKVGEKRRLTIAPEKAYGRAQGHELQNETLVFEVELLDIQ